MTQTALIEQQLTDINYLDETFRRLNRHAAYLQISVGKPLGDRWLDARSLAAPISSRRDELMQRIATTHSTDDRHVIAMWFWNAYTWPVLMGAVLSYLLERRVPYLAPANIVLHWNDAGMTDRMALRSAHFFALRDDPAAWEQDCTVVADQDALRAVLVAQITQHYVPPMLDVLATQSPFGMRALWATVADRCASAVLQATDTLGNDTCRQEVASLTKHAPLHGNTGVLVVNHNGADTLWLQRGGCCHSYKLPRYGYCATCPLLPIEERMKRLKSQLMQTIAQEG
jgi:ferric iron reductase protein FhuF